MSKGKINPDGFRLIAQSGNAADSAKLPKATSEIKLIESSNWRSLLPRACGHRGPKWFVLDVYGEKTGKIKNHKMCPGCAISYIKNTGIRCALCGLSICPGEGVALYYINIKSEGLNLDITTRVGDNVIGCLRWDCCPCGGFYAGHWSENGFVSAFSDSYTLVGETKH